MSDPSASITVFHATDPESLDSIRVEGLRSHSYWTTNSELAAYYQECLEDEGKNSVLLAMRVDLPLSASWAPDYPGLEEPISTVIGISEKQVHRQWHALPKNKETAQACLDLISSMRYEAVIPASCLLLVGMDHQGADTFEVFSPTQPGEPATKRPGAPGRRPR